MFAKYLSVLETENAWLFEIHLDVGRINSQRQPDSAWVIRRVFLKDMPLEQVEKEIAKIVQYEVARRRSRLPGVATGSIKVHPLSGAMV